MQQQNGYPAQQQAQQPQQPMLQPIQQQTKFYKSGLFGFSSAAGRFERDLHKMEKQGWKVGQYAFLGTNFWWQRCIAVTYQQ
ncbi:hypothetical protein ccbrp13_38870 [Ktedonobacteria bacterium brp13]|nr:hypothetical protein ccbrp13_38870 [Ktedonobacteria bacterium brp13]